MNRVTVQTPTGAALKLDNPATEQEARKQLMEAYKVAVNKLAAYEDAEESGEILNGANYTKLTVRNKATGEEIAVITNDEITTAADIVAALTPKYKDGDDVCRN